MKIIDDGIIEVTNIERNIVIAQFVILRINSLFKKKLFLFMYKSSSRTLK